MKSSTQQQKSQEFELKLTLPYSDRDFLVEMLKESAPLARCKSINQRLLSVYYDTPEQDLRTRRIALRVRQVDSRTGPVWVQTLKTGGVSGSALTLRGEWEVKVKDSDLSFDALEATPWREIDPDGTIYQALLPCFTTRFERTSWQVLAKDQSVVEVALDIGQIESVDQYAPICELELELKAGTPSLLFETAHIIAASVAVLPASLSKAERGYALAQGTLYMPQRSSPPSLSTDNSLVEAAQQVFRETFFQFTRNLDILLLTDNAEVVHQARVGWRRFKSALRLFKPVIVQDRIPAISSFQPLLDSLGQLRDLDVALTETAPLTSSQYVALDLIRQKHWDNFERSLAEAAQIQRKKVRDALLNPAIGLTMLNITCYVETMSPIDGVVRVSNAQSLESWTKRRLEKLEHKLHRSFDGVTDKDGQHRARILAKRLRYGLESMHSVLQKRLVKRLLKKATDLQGSIGLSRDFQRLCQLAAEFSSDAGLVEFLRGYDSALDLRNERESI